MPVAPTGTPQYVTANNLASGSNSFAITVPADCDCIVYSYGGYPDTALDQLNFDGDADNVFTLIEASIRNRAYYILSTSANWPGTGEKTLYHSATGNFGDGPWSIVFFLKGVATSDTIIGTDKEDDASSNWTCDSLGTVGADDMGFIIFYQYDGAIDVDPTGYGQTALFESGGDYNMTYYGVGYELGEDQLRAESAGSYGRGIAFAIKAAAGGSSYDETISEKINLADTQRAGMIYGMSIREVANLGESLGPQAVYNVSRSETLSMLDAVKAGILIAMRVNETISLRDIEIAQAVFSPHIREQIGLAEQIKGQFVFTPQVSERISLADAITAGFLFNLNLNEVASLTDAVIAELAGGAQIFNESLNERISIADSVTAILQFYADIRESVSLSEAVKSASILNLSLRDFLSIRDQAAEGVRVFFDTITEKLSLSDNVAAMFIHSLALSESISVADSNKAQLTFNLSVTDHIQLTDALAAIFKFGLIVTENLTVGDIVVGTVTPATITIARGKTFIFSVDIGKATGGIAAKKGAPDIKKFH